MPNDKDFWKNLMGDDDFREDGTYQDESTETPETPADGFKIEYVDKEGETFGTSDTIVPGRKGTDPGKARKASDEASGPNDFEIDFDFDKEYNDEHEKPVQKQRVKRTGCLSGILYFLFVLCVGAVLACLGWMAATDVLGFGDKDEIVEITLDKSIFKDKEIEKETEDGKTEKKTIKAADIDTVAAQLRNNGLIKYEWLFKLYSKFSNADEKLQAGTYQLNKNYDYRALVYGMTTSGGTRVEVDVTIPEGYSLKQMIAVLVKNRVCTEEELWDAAANYDFEYDFLSRSTLGDKYRLEGYLFPDTYKFYVGDTASRVLDKFLTNFNNKWTDDFSAQAEELGYTQREIITIASMIEKEAGADSERDTISSVIRNRLESSSFPCLQIDATVYYGMAINGDGDRDFSTEYESPYNSYTNEGLPPGPIANPGIASIRAALYADDTKYYYYALGLEGTHEFFKNYDSFAAFVNSDQYAGNRKG